MDLLRQIGKAVARGPASSRTVSKQGRIEKEPFLAAARPAGLRPPQSPSSTGLQASLRGLLCTSSPAGLSLADNWLFLDASLFRLCCRLILVASQF
ncbi:MAG: hypothetical protein HYZ71_07370 [Deltaproteobacteria bacterium]|nr:hypothetical protein [Deltaproteobacteria bacterium]